MSVPLRPRVVYDCNILLQAVITAGGPSSACVRLVEDSRVLLLLSPEILGEVRGVLTRPFVRQRVPEFTVDKVDRFLAGLSYLAEVTRDVPRVIDLPRDVDDAPYADLAVAAGAAFLVTRDADLLDLGFGHSAAAKQFRQLTLNRTKVVDPVSFLREVAGSA